MHQEAPTIPGWRGEFVGNNIFRYFLVASSGRVVLTGGGTDDIQEMKVPKGHRLIRLEVHHTDSADADNTTDTVTISVRKRHVNDLYIAVEEILAVLSWWINWTFGEGQEETGADYRLLFNGTANNRVYPMIYIQYLREN